MKPSIGDLFRLVIITKSIPIGGNIAPVIVSKILGSFRALLNHWFWYSLGDMLKKDWKLRVKLDACLKPV